MLLGGELDLSPISAFTWAANADELVLLPDLCIGARDDVVSVVLVSATPPALLDGARIYVTEESASGRNLLRVILERRYGVRPRLRRRAAIRSSARSRANRRCSSATRRSTRIERFPAERVYDLGTLWHEWTRRQTVFAVWAARRDATSAIPMRVRACMHALTDAYTWSRSHAADGDRAGAARDRAAGGLLRNVLRQTQLHVPRGRPQRLGRVLPRVHRDRRDRRSSRRRFRRSLGAVATLNCSIAPPPAGV